MMVIPSAFADHANVPVSIPAGSQFIGCEETNECYMPAEVTIDVGSEVTWTNDDTAVHTVTSGTIEDSESVGAIFDSSMIMAGKTFTHKFEEAGEFPYFCIVHPWMAGMVIVQEASVEDGDHADAAHVTAMTMDGSVMITVEAGAPMEGEEMALTVEFTDADGTMIEHVNFDISATQDGTEVLAETGQHVHSGSADFTTSALSSDSAVDIQITMLGIGLPDDEANWSGPMGETISLNVVPEFGPIAMIVLAAAIVSIVAVTARSKAILKL
ncbi:PEFG-CTERM sorting domain-containing protein [Candidatus Parcubacteria bacterium]|nr:MAG: PEFG-CTERM sorting domain-containing protein [Candidatus Parcubacteria bacterium]